MAVSTSSYFSFGAVGITQVGADFNPQEESSVPKYRVGHMIERADGARFRYAQFGATVGVGTLVAQDMSESSAALNAITVVAPASAQTTTDGTVGSFYIEGTIASITAGQYAGGILVIAANTGVGWTYPIIDNTATGDPASGNIRIELGLPIQAYDLNASSDIVLLGPKWGNLEIATAGTDCVVAGVSCSAIGTAGNFGWVQTRGVCGVLEEGTLVLGDVVTLSDITSGAVMKIGGYAATGGESEIGAEQIVGTSVGIAGDGTYGLVDLIIE